MEQVLNMLKRKSPLHLTFKLKQRYNENQKKRNKDVQEDKRTNLKKPDNYFNDRLREVKTYLNTNIKATLNVLHYWQGAKSTQPPL
jgi:hypothetical protein